MYVKARMTQGRYKVGKNGGRERAMSLRHCEVEGVVSWVNHIQAIHSQRHILESKLNSKVEQNNTTCHFSIRRSLYIFTYVLSLKVFIIQHQSVDLTYYPSGTIKLSMSRLSQVRMLSLFVKSLIRKPLFLLACHHSRVFPNIIGQLGDFSLH